MMGESWVVEYLAEVAAVDRQLADLVERLVLSPDAAVARRLASSIELKVAPPSGGLSSNVSGVVSAVIAHLPTMAPSARPCAVALLSQVAGSLLSVNGASGHDVSQKLLSALPGIAALAQKGDSELQADFVDFAALCADLDHSASGQVAFYLQRVVAEVGGNIGASAQLELERLGAA